MVMQDQQGNGYEHWLDVVDLKKRAAPERDTIVP
jgi:hypothetical protein